MFPSKKIMKKKNKAKISSVKTNLFRELTDKELKQIKGGQGGTAKIQDLDISAGLDVLFGTPAS